MSDMVHKILLSKRVATRILEDVRKEGRSVTVFVSNEDEARSFVASVSGLGVITDVGFDQVTLVALSQPSVKKALAIVKAKGFDWTDL